jgi:Fe2+ transport system protein FeoA
MSTFAKKSAPSVVPLEMLAAGEVGTIVEIDGQADLVTRLQEMGLRPGCEVRMIRPGRACIVAVDNHRFSFRSAEAATVMVALQTHDSARWSDPSPA